MPFAPYDDDQIRAAQALLELFIPPEHSLDAAAAAFAAALEDVEDEEAPIYLLLHQTLGSGAFAAEEEDPQALIASLRSLGEQWGATLLFGAHDWEGTAPLAGSSAEVLALAALELRAYGLSLWQWEGAEEWITGFISRAQDADLMEKLAEQCGADLWQVEEADWE